MTREKSAQSEAETEQRKVVCENCNEFEMEKQFHGVAGTTGEQEFAGISLPDECPVCGSETTEVDDA